MGKVGFTFRRIWLLLWKNALMRRRHYIITALEIILPTLLAIVIVYIRAKVDFDRAPPEYRPDENGDTGFPVDDENDLINWFTRYWPCHEERPENCTIAYTPNNQLTRGIVNKIIESISDYAGDEGYEYYPRGFDTEQDIELYKQTLDLPIPGPKDLLQAAIVFYSEDVLDRNTGKISYKIRMDDYYETDEIFPLFQLPGPDFSNDGKYAKNGFSGIQILLDKVLISHFAKQDINDVPTFNVSTQTMPHPEYPAFDFNQLYQFVLPQFTVQGFIFIVPSIVRAVVAEKETGIKELMKMMGLPNWMHWVGWLINSLLALIISITFTVILYFVEFTESGAVLVHSDPTLWWFILFLYTISGSAFCFFVSSFFQKATLATTIGVILWVVTYQPVQLYLEPRYADLPLAVKMLTCLLPNMAIHYSYLIMCGFEAKGEGAKWGNIAQTLNSTDSLTVLHIVAMFIINTFIYIALAMYVENVMPTKYGVRKPWYYIFRLSTWWSTKSIPDENTFEDSIRAKQREDRGFESEPTDLNVGMDIRGLRKTFGKAKVAVDNVTLKMFHGQITALLGHNGAGKTTTISMLTGLYSPSGGTAYVNGYDINTNLAKVRENLGLCPQHNMLFNKLTVAEHLNFFGRLKGLTVDAAKKEVEILLRQLQLEDKKSTMSMNLSGGQKRKVSLGCALIGGSKVVVLDEPTSGMDPEARRAIWDLLLELRANRTILLTTHFMEEADVLGDRIAIMADGKLQCCGSPMFLKQFYGAGYTLKLTLTHLANPTRILSTVRAHIPQAYFKSQNLLNEKEVSIVLPTNNTPSSVFVPLFRDLSHTEIKSEVETMGLSLTTMDEVFVKVGEINHDKHEETLREASPVPSFDTGLDAFSSSRDNLHSETISGFRLTAQQFWALLLKRILYTFRKYRHFISQFIIPVAVLIIAILVSNRNFGTHKPQPPLEMSFKDYKKPMTLFRANDAPEGYIRTFESVANGLGTATAQVTGNLSESLLEVAKSDLGLYRESYVVAVEFNSSEEFNAMYSSIPYHASPLAINLVSNVVMKQMLIENGQPNEDITLEVTNHRLPNTFYNIIERIVPDPAFATSVAVLFSTILPIGLGLLAATYIIFAVDERLCKAKQLQLMTGVNPMMYWFSSFVWDYFMMIIVICMMIACFPIFELHRAFSSNNGTGVVFLFLAVFGYSAIWFSYLISLWVSSVPGGFALVSIVHIMAGMLNLVVDALDSDNTRSVQTFFRWFGRLFPAYGAGACSYHYSRLAAANSICQLVPEDVVGFICVPDFPFSRFAQQCCDNCKELGAPCFEPSPFIKWKYELLNDEPGIGQELVYMAISGFIYQIILAGIELGAFRAIKRAIFKTDKHSFTQSTRDEDVTREVQRVNNLMLDRRVDADAMVVQNLSKSYGTFAAVSGITFGVHHGECFGLLGVNGAGKTTTFRMLTGDEVCSDGNAIAGMFGLTHKRKDFLSTIGYCPQFDGVIGVLHGREMLQLFARLRGVRSRNVTAEADKWLAKLGLSESANVQCEKYSGGMKRRLSAAMAMVADPAIILLDEPTSGVDPVARRQFWEVITSIRNSGQAIILTSHSMEECEALCTRLGIMVNGEMQCLGGVQHLKNKFAQGFSLTIKLKSVANSGGIVQELNQEISRRFDPCALKDQHQNILQYQVYNTEMPWDALFQNMEDVKLKYAQIVEEYSVSGTTLEEVFLSFARKQYVGREANISCFKKFITCQCFGQR